MTISLYETSFILLHYLGRFSVTYGLWMNSSGWPFKWKLSEQYFHVVLFIMLYRVVLTFKSVDVTLMCDHSNESYWAVLSCGTVYYAVQGGSNFYVCEYINPYVWLFKWTHWAVLSCGAVYYAVQGGYNFNSVDEIPLPVCDHST